MNNLKLLVCLLLLAPVFIQAQEWGVSIDGAITYKIEAGKQNFSPKEPVCPQFGVDGFEIAVRFPASAWVGLEEWKGDKDWYDWNKLKGETGYFSPNNKSSVMIAWRWGLVPYTFQLIPYTNQKDGSWTVTGSPVTIYAEEIAYARGLCNRRSAYYEIEYFGIVTQYEHDWKRPWPWIAREIGTWIGGDNNSPGPYGGKATQDMEMEVAFKTYK